MLKMFKKKESKPIFKFYCKHCDIFVYKEDIKDNLCPGCFKKMEVYDSIMVKE